MIKKIYLAILLSDIYLSGVFHICRLLSCRVSIYLSITKLKRFLISISISIHFNSVLVQFKRHSQFSSEWCTTLMSKHVSSSFYTIKYQSLCQSSTSPLLLIPPVVVGIDSGCFEHIVWQLRVARVSLVPHWCCRVLDRATAGEFTRWFRQNQSIPFWAVAIHEATVYSKPSAHRTRGLCWLIVVIDGFSRWSWRVTHLHVSVPNW